MDVYIPLTTTPSLNAPEALPMGLARVSEHTTLGELMRGTALATGINLNLTAIRFEQFGGDSVRLTFRLVTGAVLTVPAYTGWQFDRVGREVYESLLAERGEQAPLPDVYRFALGPRPIPMWEMVTHHHTAEDIDLVFATPT